MLRRNELETQIPSNGKTRLSMFEPHKRQIGRELELNRAPKLNWTNSRCKPCWQPRTQHSSWETCMYLLHFEIWFNRYIRQILSGWLCRVLLLISPLFSKPWFHLVWTLGWKLPGGTLYHMSYIAHRQIKLQSSSVDLYWLSIIFPWNWLAIKSVIVVKS